MERKLEELIKRRKNLVKVHEENGFTEGIHALLTDLYPDTAHFIFELLQNAEDMDASTVRFSLSEHGIRFEHNGTKRPFNIADIESITNIGKDRQKRDDPTSIGKFGVGFKAVLAYTATPIIHSASYHFRIEDYFVPEFSGVSHIETVDPEGTDWTVFELPFNNPSKPEQKAFRECRAGLIGLDNTAILFLKNIRSIEYSLPGGETGFVRRSEAPDDPQRITIVSRSAGRKSQTSSNWLRFSEDVDLVDDKGDEKRLPIALAYQLEPEPKTKTLMTVPVSGKTFIYFPAEKEHSGLRFHINAPFASTVARDSVRDCRENQTLIKKLARLISSSLAEIKARGLMNHSFFELLPNDRDELSPFYRPILDGIISAFKNHAYLPERNGRGYVTAKKAITASSDIASLFSGADLRKAFGIEKSWIQNAPRRNSNADLFIRCLGVQEFTNDDFIRLFETENLQQAEQFLKQKDDRWLRQFYVLCADVFSSSGRRYQFAVNMKQAKCIRSETGELLRPDEIFILPPRVRLITDSTPVVGQAFIKRSSKQDKTGERLITFFRDGLGIREYGPRVEIERILSKYARNGSGSRITADETYFSDLIQFAEYASQFHDVPFSAYELFLSNGPENEDQRASAAFAASGLFIGSAYGNPAGDLLAESLGQQTLWDGYAQRFTKEKYWKLRVFCEKCGINRGLRVVSQSPRCNPQFMEKLYSDRNSNGKGTSEDYTIPGLEKLLQCVRSAELAALIWDCLIENGTGWKDYSKARYSPNGSARVKECDSTLIYLLKKYAWVPDKSGELFRPGEITEQRLTKRFRYDPHNRLLAALGIGSGADQEREKFEAFKKKLEAAGKHIIDDEEYRSFEEYKARLGKRREVKAHSPEELLKKQTRKQAAGDLYEDDFSADGAVGNLRRRERSIEDTFRNKQGMKPQQRKLFGRISDSGKEERSRLRNWYQGTCQMCNTRIVGHDGQPYFIAKNIIDTRDLTDRIRNTTDLAWNSLCLCPNCAARYTVCSRDISDLYEQILRTSIKEGDPEPILLTIELEGRAQSIRFIPRHFLALKKVMELIELELSSRDSSAEK